MNSLRHRAAWAIALCAGGSLPLPAQQPVNAQPIILPEFNVAADRELPSPEVWHYGRIAGHELLSSASPEATRRIADELNRFIHAVALTGTPLLPRQPARIRLYLLGRAGELERFTQSSVDEEGDIRTWGVVLGNAEGSALMLDQRAQSLRFLDDDTDGEEGPQLRNSTVVIQRLRIAYARLLLAQQRPALPAWFVEGLAQVFAAIRVTEQSVTLGAIDNPNQVLGGMAEREARRSTAGSLEPVARRSRDSLREDLDFNAALASTSLLPLAELFARTPKDFLGEGKAIDAIRWSKQCHAFVHWGLFGDLGAHEKEFLAFVQRATREAVTEELFRASFDRSFAGGLAALRTHLEMTRAKVQGVRAGPGEKIPAPPPFEVREATLLEAARLKSLAFNLGGQPELARDELALAYRRGERTPDLVAELALAELGLGHDERGRRYLNLAVKAGTTRPRAYTTLAQLRLQDRLAKPQAPGGKLSYEQLVGVLEPLLLGRQQPTRSPELYALLAEAWSAAASPPPANHLALVDEGTHLFPEDPRLRAARARLAPAATGPSR